MNILRNFAVAAVVITGSLAFVGSASATTFCVPGFTTACPDNGTNVAETSLDDAVNTDGFDGQPDRVLIAPGALVEPGPDTIDASGTDPLEVVGAGAEETSISTAASGNFFVLLLDSRPGTKMSDLTIVVPSGFPDGDGSAAQIQDAELTDVDVRIENPDSDGIDSMIGNNVLRNVDVYATSGNSVGYAFESNCVHPGVTTITLDGHGAFVRIRQQRRRLSSRRQG